MAERGGFTVKTHPFGEQWSKTGKIAKNDETGWFGRITGKWGFIRLPAITDQPPGRGHEFLALWQSAARHEG